MFLKSKPKSLDYLLRARLGLINRKPQNLHLHFRRQQLTIHLVRLACQLLRQIESQLAWLQLHTDFLDQKFYILSELIVFQKSFLQWLGFRRLLKFLLLHINRQRTKLQDEFFLLYLEANIKQLLRNPQFELELPTLKLLKIMVPCRPEYTILLFEWLFFLANKKHLL